MNNITNNTKITNLVDVVLWWILINRFFFFSLI